MRPYWIESTDGRTFVKIPELLPFETQIWAVYKKEGYVPDIDGTMVFGDDFTQDTTGQYVKRELQSGVHTLSYDAANNRMQISTSAAGYCIFVKDIPSLPESYVFESHVTISSSTHAASSVMHFNTSKLGNIFILKHSSPSLIRHDTWSPAWSANNSYSTPIDLGLHRNKIVSNAGAYEYYHNESPSPVLTGNLSYTSNTEFGMCNYDGTLYYEHIFIRKYVPVEPTVIVEDMGTWYKVVITNNIGETLTDYQVAINSTDLDISSTTESLLIVPMHRSETSNVPYADLFKDCVAYWDFMGDAKDVIGGADGTVTGATLTTDRFGVQNAAYQFTTNTDIINMGQRVLDTEGPFSVEAIFKHDTLSSMQAIVGEMGNNNTIGEFIINSMPGGALRFMRRHSASSEVTITLTDDGVIAHGNWYHVICIFDGSAYLIYVNDVLVTTTTTTGVYTRTQNNFTCVGNDVGIFYPLKGQVAMIKLYNVDISSSVSIRYRLSQTGYIYPIMHPRRLLP